MQLSVFIVGFFMAMAFWASCSGANFTGNSGKSSGSSSEQPIVEPTDVAGGYGLTCISADLTDNSSKTEISCSLVNDADQIFQEAPDKKLDVQVKSGPQSTDVAIQGAGASSNFSFSVATADISKFKMIVRILNPQDQNKVLNEISSDLVSPIRSQPTAVSAVSGRATFTVLADTSQGNVSYIWQESSSNTQGSWTVLQDASEIILGSRTNQLALGSLTSAKNNYYYRVKVFTNEKIKWRSQVAQLFVPNANDKTAPTVTNYSFETLSPSIELVPSIIFTIDEPSYISLFDDSSCGASTLLKKSELRAAGSRTMKTSTLLPSKNYTIYLKAEDQSGNATACTQVGAYKTLLPTPANLNVTASAANELSLSWTAVTSAESYTIYWRDDGPGVTTASSNIEAGNSTTYQHDGLTAGKRYFYRTAAKSNGIEGVLSEEKSAIVSTPPPAGGRCPENYVYVYANSDLGTAAFCVAKYEMKNNGGNVAVSKGAGLPWLLPRDDLNGLVGAIERCRQLDPVSLRYSLITNAQWQALARDIETAQNPAGTYLNWSNGSISGTNYINRGHSDRNPNGYLEVLDANDPCIGTDNGNCANNTVNDFSQKRTHTLKSEDIIWDVSGNAMEWVQGFPPQQFQTGWVSSTQRSDDTNNKLGPTAPANYFSKTGHRGGLGYWHYTIYSVGVWGLARGGDFFAQDSSGENSSGIFSASNFAANLVNAVGFRCVYLP